MKTEKFISWSMVVMIGFCVLTVSSCGQEKIGQVVEPVSSSLSQQMVTSGYCAVGKVDENAKTAKILLENGEIVTESYVGDAPKSGEVQTYKKENGSCTFTQDGSNFPPYGDQYKSNKITIAIRQRCLVVGSKMYINSDTVFFVRYSATDWRVVQGRKAIVQNNGGKPGYLLGTLESSGYIWFSSEFDKTAKLAHCVMIVGGCGEEGSWKPANAAVTKFMDSAGIGFDSGDKDLS
jgi:hypothetical protein